MEALLALLAPEPPSSSSASSSDSSSSSPSSPPRSCRSSRSGGSTAPAERTIRWLKARRLGLVEVEGLLLAENRRYTPAHAWLDEERGGRLRVGLDDLAGHLVHGVTAVALPQPGSTLAAGRARRHGRLRRADGRHPGARDRDGRGRERARRESPDAPPILPVREGVALHGASGVGRVPQLPDRASTHERGSAATRRASRASSKASSASPRRTAANSSCRRRFSCPRKSGDRPFRPSSSPEPRASAARNPKAALPGRPFLSLSKSAARKKEIPPMRRSVSRPRARPRPPRCGQKPAPPRPRRRLPPPRPSGRRPPPFPRLPSRRSRASRASSRRRSTPPTTRTCASRRTAAARPGPPSRRRPSRRATASPS